MSEHINMLRIMQESEQRIQCIAANNEEELNRFLNDVGEDGYPLVKALVCSVLAYHFASLAIMEDGPNPSSPQV